MLREEQALIESTGRRSQGNHARITKIDGTIKVKSTSHR